MNEEKEENGVLYAVWCFDDSHDASEGKCSSDIPYGRGV